MPKVTIKLFEEEKTFELKDALDSKDIPEAIATFSLHLAEGIYQQRLLEAEAKEQRSKFFSEMLKKDPKAPEWKLRNRYERSDSYKAFQQGAAMAERTVNRLTAILEGLKARVYLQHK